MVIDIKRDNMKKKKKDVSKKQDTNSSVDIVETQVTKSSEGSVILATVKEGTTQIITNRLPDKIDLKAKQKKEATRNGKKVLIVTFRDFIINLILSVFFIIAIGAGCYGIYKYVFKDNPANFQTINVYVEYGEEIPTSVSSYINLNDVNEPDYTLDTSEVRSEIGTYTFKVTYGSITKTGNITIQDTKAPIITFKDDLVFTQDVVVDVDMLVDSCTDINGCNYELTYPVDTSTAGDVLASVSVTDNLGNEEVYTVNLKINEKIIKLTCYKDDMTTITSGYYRSTTYDLSFNNLKNLQKGTIINKQRFVNQTIWSNMKDSLTTQGYVLSESDTSASLTEDTSSSVANLTNLDEIQSHLISNGYNCSVEEN